MNVVHRFVFARGDGSYAALPQLGEKASFFAIAPKKKDCAPLGERWSTVFLTSSAKR